MNEKKLLEIIKENEINYIYDILKYTNKSESTVRRCLKKLQGDGFIKLSYGGNIKLVEGLELSISDNYKKKQLIIAKNKIAKQAVSYIKDGDVIFIDNGTTVRSMFKYLGQIDVVIYTNGYNHLDIANKNKLKLKLIPGDVIYKEASIVGEEAINFIADITFDHVFLGANGYEQMAGITTPNLSESLLKKMAIKRAINAHILMDHTKYKKVSKYKIANMNEVNLIID